MQKERKSDAFQEMLAVAKGWLAGRSPEELAKLAGAEWKPEEKILSLQSLGSELASQGIGGDDRPQQLSGIANRVELTF